MLKKSITYTDFNGEETTEVFFFHLSKAELIELEMSKEGGLVDSMQRVIKAEDNRTILAEMKKIVLLAYGQKTPDGKRFVKNDRLREEFESSEAYSVLFMELLTDAGKAAEFMAGIIPPDLAQQAAAVAQADTNGGAKVEEAGPTITRTVTAKELREMSPEELAELGPKLASGEVSIADELPG